VELHIYTSYTRAPPSAVDSLVSQSTSLLKNNAYIMTW